VVILAMIQMGGLGVVTLASLQDRQRARQ